SKLLGIFRHQPGGIDTGFLQHLQRTWINPFRAGTGTGHLKLIRRHLAQYGLGHLRTGRIAAAQEQNTLLHRQTSNICLPLYSVFHIYAISWTLDDFWLLPSPVKRSERFFASSLKPQASSSTPYRRKYLSHCQTFSKLNSEPAT